MSKILLVDDSALIRGVLETFLASKGYEVILAENGLEGILAAYRHVPDLIVTDVEMPRLQGYQMSRLLKSRREIRKIPIIMHTSLSEDRDKFWADSSGAEAFITKDFDNLEALAAQLKSSLAKAVPVDRDLIAEDAAGMGEAAALEMLGSLFDGELFKSTIMNELNEVERHIGSLSLSAAEVLKILRKVCQVHIGVLILRQENDAQMYILPSTEVVKADVERFQAVCLREFEGLAGPMTGQLTAKVLGVEGRADYERGRIDGRRLSSLHSAELRGKGETVIGTLHVGNLANNYFSELIVGNIRSFADGAAPVLENAVLFRAINEMRRKIDTMFSKFVPQEVIRELLSRRSDTEMKIGEKRSVAILFSDIRSFTVISENNSAEKIVDFLNRYFQLMVRIIRAQGGIIDKFIGDAILAVFGAPVSYEDNAARAVRAAVAMAEALRDFDTSGLVLPEGGFRAGIGIHEGDVIVGNIGSEDKFDYTVIGDNVNLASRLEGLTKHYRATILVSDAVRRAVGEELRVREVDTVRVMGREQATTLYSIESADQGLVDEAACEVYRKALSMYKMRNWTTAIDYFRQVLAKRSDDYLSLMYIDRCEEFAKNPPPDDWEGTIRLDFK